MSKAASEKVAFITGANKGIGLETARSLGRKGFTVILGSRDEARGRKAAEQLRSEGLERVEAVRFDVTSAADQRAIAQYLDSRFGKLDVLVNNAGVQLEDVDFGHDFNTTSRTKPEILARTFETNFFAVVALTQALLPLIRQAPPGRIVNLSSVLGSLTVQSDPDSPYYHKKAFAYDASKTALNAFTVHLAEELRGTKIKVNSAHPGWVKTDMGGSLAPLDVSAGAKTSVELATLPDDGPTGGYFHLGERLPW